MQLNIDKTEVLRYLAAKVQPNASYSTLLDECIDEILSLIRPRYLFKVLGRKEAAPLLAGTDINKHLESSTYIILLAATLGTEVERSIRLYEQADMARAVIMDAACTDAVEKVCDAACLEISKQPELDGLFFTDRFSPGYGDMPLCVQSELLQMLDTRRRIGLSCTDRFLLTPRKSVTALVGAGNYPQYARTRGCPFCPAREHCIYRKEGRRCDADRQDS